MTQESPLTVRPVTTGEGPTAVRPATPQAVNASTIAFPVPRIDKSAGSENETERGDKSPKSDLQKLDEAREAMERLRAKLDELRSSGLLRETKLEIEFDEDLGDQMLVKIIDKETDEVVREVPPRELVEFAKRLSEAMGVLLDTLA